MGRKNLYYPLILALSFLTVQCIAQSKVLKVYNAFGVVTIIRDGKQDVARRGTAVNSASLLKLSGLSSVMLIDSSGLYTQVDKPGNYSYSSLLEQIKKLSRSTVSSRFFKYVYATLVEEHTPPPGNNIIAGVFRGQVPMKAPADSSVIAGDSTIIFKWIKERPKLPFRFIVREGNTKKILIDSVFKTELSLTVSIKRLSSGHVYEWTIDEKDTKQPHSVYFSFIVAKKEDSADIKKESDFINSFKTGAHNHRLLRRDLFSKWQSFYAGH